jgi:hypothetical protein
MMALHAGSLQGTTEMSAKPCAAAAGLFSCGFRTAQLRHVGLRAAFADCRHIDAVCYDCRLQLARLSWF